MNLMHIIFASCIYASIIHFSILIIQLFVGFLVVKEESDVKFNGQFPKTVALIPVCNEDPLILKKTIDSCNKVIGLSHIVVIENSTDLFKKRVVVSLCDRENINYISIPNQGNKAKALNFFFKRVLK